MEKEIIITAEAERVAREISGTWNWQGCHETIGTPKMAKSIQKYLESYRLTAGTGIHVIECQQDDEISVYYPCWDADVARKANRENRKS